MITELETIREYGLLNTSEVAKIIGVSRPTVYAWIEGKEPCPANVLKLCLLADNLRKIVEANISRANNLIKRPLFDGVSILDILIKGDGIPEDHITRLKTIATSEEVARKKQKGFPEMTTTVDQVACNTAVYTCDY